MKGSTLALLVGGGLAVGGAVYFLRKKAEVDKCANLSALDARAGALCRLGVIDAAGEVLETASDAANKVAWVVLKPVRTVVDGIMKAFSGCDDNCQRRGCEQIRDTGRFGPFGGFEANEALRAKFRPNCKRLGVDI